MDSPKSNTAARENAIPGPVAQIISAQSMAIAQLTKINEDLAERYNTLMEKFTNYDLNRLKLYDESMKYFMQGKNQQQTTTHGQHFHPIGGQPLEQPQAQQTVSGGGPVHDEKQI